MPSFHVHPRSFTRWCGLLLGAAAAAAVWDARGAAHPGAVGVTWTGTAAHIVQRRCASCHAQGGMGRPRLDTFADARMAADDIRQVVMSRHLPRWYAADGFGDFGNDPTLTPHEAEMLAQWADGRAPLGDPAGLEESKTVSEGAGARVPLVPGLTLRVPGKHRITAPSHTFELPTGIDDARWIRGWKVEPGNRALVTGAVLALKSGRTLGTWAPGDEVVLLPGDVAYRLPPRSTILLTVYYRRPPGPAVDASSLDLYFAPEPKREVESMLLPCGSTRLSRSVDVLSVRPPLGSAGRSLEVVTRGTDRAIEPLARFDAYPADHAQTYWLRSSRLLPAGSSVDVRAAGAACGAELDVVRAGDPIEYRPSPGDRAATAGEGDGGYWCPMHADVRASGPGECGRCGMALVPTTPRVPGRYWLDASVAPRALKAGQPVMLRLAVREPGSDDIVRKFETVHDRTFHLFVVSEDLQEFSHVHPAPQPDGSLALPLTLARPGAYRLYADFLPVGGTPQMISRTLIVEKPATGSLQRKRKASPPEPSADPGLRADLQLESGEIVAGVPSYVSFTLTDSTTGLPVTDLEPFLGAWGHMFIVGSDLSTAVHSHPTTSLDSPGGPTIFFQQRFPRAGSYRMWVQFQRRGNVITLPFSVHVSASRRAVE